MNTCYILVLENNPPCFQTVVSTTVGGVSLECSMGEESDYIIPKAMIAVRLEAPCSLHFVLMRLIALLGMLMIKQ